MRFDVEIHLTMIPNTKNSSKSLTAPLPHFPGNLTFRVSIFHIELAYFEFFYIHKSEIAGEKGCAHLDYTILRDTTKVLSKMLYHIIPHQLYARGLSL